MDWCSVYLTPQGLPKYIYRSPPLIFPTTYNGIRTKNLPVWITPGAAPIRWMGPIRNPRWEQKRTEGYVIVSTSRCRYLMMWKYNCESLSWIQYTLASPPSIVSTYQDVRIIYITKTNNNGPVKSLTKLGHTHI